jgi:tetratricopeptide (TPR) repeat protein
MTVSGLPLLFRTFASGLVFSLICAGVAQAQGMLEVAEKQMAAGLGPDARTLVEAALVSSPVGEKDRALYLRAVLTASGDSAAAALEEFTKSSLSDTLKAQGLERLGDLAYSQGKYGAAAACWQQACETGSGSQLQQRLLTKISRASLRMRRPHGALSSLRQAQQLGEPSQQGMVHYWRGMAERLSGDSDGAAGEFMASYTQPGHRYSLSTLYRLNEIYGQGESKNARQWRDRWRESSKGTVFDTKHLPSSMAGGYIIQLGAFSTDARARSLAREVRSLGLDAIVRFSAADSLYRVRIEAIPSRKELEKIISVLKKNRMEYHLVAPGG